VEAMDFCHGSVLSRLTKWNYFSMHLFLQETTNITVDNVLIPEHNEKGKKKTKLNFSLSHAFMYMNLEGNYPCLNYVQLVQYKTFIDMEVTSVFVNTYSCDG
jgi:hypothetical protein